MDRRLSLGSVYLGRRRCSFVVWSPWSDTVDLRILAPRSRTVRLQSNANGYHRGVLDEIEPGALYVYRLDGLIERPDPASRCQPHGPRGPTCLIDSRFAWKDRPWRGLALSEYIIHESSDSTAAFDDLIPGLGPLRDLGATALSVRLDTPPLSGLPGSVPVSRGGPAGAEAACRRLPSAGACRHARRTPFRTGYRGGPLRELRTLLHGPGPPHQYRRAPQRRGAAVFPRKRTAVVQGISHRHPGCR